jgi:alpha-N-acetylglucosaminidase
LKNFIFFLLLLPFGVVAKTPVDALIERVAEGGARNVVTEIVPGDGDFFEVAPRRGKVVITGNTPVNIAAGFNWYLKYVAGVHLSWNNLTQKMPAKMPLPAETIRKTADHELRYYLNFCTFSYSMPFWDWARWEKELDWMALHGINLALNITGNELVWRNLLRRVGYTDAEVNDFVAGPAFQAWWQMNNIEGWGGPNTEEWYDRQHDLQLNILGRMREMGIEPIFPGYAGMVPRNIGAKLGYDIADPGLWCKFPRPAFLSPADNHFDGFADMYYEEMEKLYGKANYYAMDPFHEGGKTAGIDVPRAAKTILAAMRRANPDAVWVAQGWQDNPRREIMNALDAGDMLILDLYSEKMPKWGDPQSAWYTPEGYGSHDWVFCMLLNFGGRTGLHGRMESVVDGYYKARDEKSATLKGVGATPEAIENNPMMFELLFELPWRGEKFSPREWLDGYLAARYGKVTDNVRQAWEILYNTVYNTPRTWPGEGAVECLVCARPGLHLKRTSTWGSAQEYYDPALMERAAQLMLADAHIYKGNDNFDYDLVDVRRQALADRANKLVEQFSDAHDAGDMERFHALGREFMAVIGRMDSLLAERPEFRLDTWIPAGGDPWLEWNARTLVTTWGPRIPSNQGGLHDYSHRQWHGLMGLYAARWQRFFDLDGNVGGVDWFAMEEEFARGR